MRLIPFTPFYSSPVGMKNPAVPASTVAYTNAYNADATVYIIGGTITVIAVDGNTTGLTSAANGVTVRVPNGSTITLTYSVAPTWNWMVD